MTKMYRIHKWKEQVDMTKFQLLTSNTVKPGKQQKIKYFLRICMTGEQDLVEI